MPAGFFLLPIGAPLPAGAERMAMRARFDLGTLSGRSKTARCGHVEETDPARTAAVAIRPNRHALEDRADTPLARPAATLAGEAQLCWCGNRWPGSSSAASRRRASLGSQGSHAARQRHRAAGGATQRRKRAVAARRTDGAGAPVATGRRRHRHPCVGRQLACGVARRSRPRSLPVLGSVHGGNATLTRKILRRAR